MKADKTCPQSGGIERHLGSWPWAPCSEAGPAPPVLRLVFLEGTGASKLSFLKRCGCKKEAF